MSEWSLLGIEPTSDKRLIKRAYAKLIKTIDPSKDPLRFQEVKEAYDYLLNYGRHYVDEDNSRQTKSSPTASFSEKWQTSELAQVESAKADTELEIKIDLTEQAPFQNNDSLAADTLDTNQTREEDDSFKLSAETHTDEHQAFNGSQENELVHSTRQLQQQEFATDFPQKTSYQSANEFIDKLDSLFWSKHTVEKSDWIALIEDQEYQFFETIEQLRVDVFGYLVHQIESHWEAGNQPEKLKLKLLEERLPQDFEWLVKYLAEHFDWQNTELILSNHFRGEQMKLLGQFYLNNIPKQAVEVAGEKSNTKHYFFWIIFLFVLVKIFSAMDDGVSKDKVVEEQASLPSFLESIKPSVFCSKYILINSDERANQCEQRLLPNENKKRVILALYWFNQFDAGKRATKAQVKLDEFLDKGFELLSQASENNYIPANNLLAWMKIGKRYQRQDTENAKSLLEKSSSFGDNTATVALAVGYYAGLWGPSNPEKADSILRSIIGNENHNTSNLNYVLAACHWLGVIKPNTDQNRAEMKQRASLMFLDNSKSADLSLINNVAWYFATADDETYDSVLALNLARQFQPEFRNSQNWQYIDTLAAAYAARNNFEMALKSIEKATQLVEAEYNNPKDPERIEALKELNEHRSLFQQKKRIKTKPAKRAMYDVLRASFSELMKINLHNLPD